MDWFNWGTFMLVLGWQLWFMSLLRDWRRFNQVEDLKAENARLRERINETSTRIR